MAKEGLILNMLFPLITLLINLSYKQFCVRENFERGGDI